MVANNVQELIELLTKAQTKKECYEILKANKFHREMSNPYPGEEGNFKGTHWHYNSFKYGFDVWQEDLYIHEKEFIDSIFTSTTDFDSQVYNFPDRKIGHRIEVGKRGKELIVIDINNKF